MQKYIDFHTCPPVPLVVAHRGARGHAPENTLTAAALGYAVQADLWELDANYTKDGKLVVMHDDTLVRTTDVETAFPGRPSYRVCDFTLDEIKSLDAGSWYAGRDQFGRVAAGEIDADTLKSFDGLTVPTLEEALAFTKDNGWYVNVEIKNHSHLMGRGAAPLLARREGRSPEHRDRRRSHLGHGRTLQGRRKGRRRVPELPPQA